MLVRERNYGPDPGVPLGDPYRYRLLFRSSDVHAALHEAAKISKRVEKRIKAEDERRPLHLRNDFVDLMQKIQKQE